MRFGNQSWRLLTAFALVALASSTVFAQSVTTRIVNAGQATTTAKIVPGGSASAFPIRKLTISMMSGHCFQ